MTGFNRISFGAVAALLTTATLAQPYQSKGEVEGWKIFVNEANNSCFMETRTKDGLILQMGTGGDVDMGYLALYAAGESDIRNGETGEIRIRLGDQDFAGMAEASTRDGYSGGYFLGNNPLLGYDLSTQPQMIVNPDGTNQFTVDLDGAGAAINATRACQAEIGG